MADLDAVLEQLQRERKRAESELKQLDRVIAQLSKAVGSQASSYFGTQDTSVVFSSPRAHRGSAKSAGRRCVRGKIVFELAA